MTDPLNNFWHPELCPLPRHDLWHRVYGFFSPPPVPQSAPGRRSRNYYPWALHPARYYGWCIWAYWHRSNEPPVRAGKPSSNSARSLLLSERTIFLNLVGKDTVYYFILWVFPFTAGFAIASPFIGVPLSLPLWLMLTLTFSFLTGLSLVFFLSTIYARSKQMLLFIFVLFFIGWAGLYQAMGINVAVMYPPLTLFKTFRGAPGLPHVLLL